MQRSNSRPSHLPPRSELSAALASCRGAFLGTALISGMSNILTLAGAMFMLEIYDRVLPSRSMPTLVGLVVLVAGLFTALGILDAIRGRILARIGGALDESLSGRVYDYVGAAAVADRQPQRRPSAVARPRCHPLLSFQPRPGRPVRSALDPALSRDLLCLPPSDRFYRARRRHHPDWADRADRVAPARTDEVGDRSRRLAQRAWPKPAGATPRRSPPWAWSAVSRSAGARPTASICAASGMRATLAAASAPSPRCCA